MQSSANPFGIPTAADLDAPFTTDYSRLIDEDENDNDKKPEPGKTSTAESNPFDADIDTDLIYRYVQLGSGSATKTAEAKEGKEKKENTKTKSSSKPKRLLDEQEIELLANANDRRPSSTSYQPLTIRRTQMTHTKLKRKRFPHLLSPNMITN